MFRKQAQYMLVVGLTTCLVGLFIFLISPTSVTNSQSLDVPQFVGADSCADCHEAEAAQHALHGHNFKLNRVVDGVPPTYPFTEVLELPVGYTWDDISFVIGGFAWKARFIDLEGYIITGDENATTQYNFPLIDDRTGDVIVEENWVAYHAGEENKPYSCGSCHTTGYNHDSDTNMYGLPGLIGQWTEEGIQCEECHGPGSLHAENPINVQMLVDRDSESCGNCHYRGGEGVVESSGGFIKHHEQYEEIVTAPHAALDCVNCHNPHQSAVWASEVNPNRSIRNDCLSCHFDTVNIDEHEDEGVTCVDCHMPPMTASGARNADLLWADVKTHLFQINTNPDAPQFSEDGSSVMPYITLEYACTRCHSDWTVDDMEDGAKGYHD